MVTLLIKITITHFIDTNEVNKILEIIQAVYYSHSNQRDTVFNKYKIHSLLNNIVKSIVIDTHVDAPEIINLSKE